MLFIRIVFHKDAEHIDTVALKMGPVRNSKSLKFSCQSQSRPFLPRGTFPSQASHGQKEAAIYSENIQGMDR